MGKLSVFSVTLDNGEVEITKKWLVRDENQAEWYRRVLPGIHHSFHVIASSIQEDQHEVLVRRKKGWFGGESSRGKQREFVPSGVRNGRMLSPVS